MVEDLLGRSQSLVQTPAQEGKSYMTYFLLPAMPLHSILLPLSQISLSVLTAETFFFCFCFWLFLHLNVSSPDSASRSSHNGCFKLILPHTSYNYQPKPIILLMLVYFSYNITTLKTVCFQKLSTVCSTLSPS